MSENNDKPAKSQVKRPEDMTPEELKEFERICDALRLP